MKKDLPENTVQDVCVAIALESSGPEAKNWKVYLVNLKKTALETVLVTSKGYGQKDGKDVKTSVLRHSLGNIESMHSAAIEAIDEEVFGLTNEYWLSYYIDDVIYDKKFIFLPESIVDANLTRIPVVNKAGVMIG